MIEEKIIVPPAPSSRPSKCFLYFGLFLLPFFASGCSLLLISTGLNPPDTFNSEASVKSIRKSLGKPILVETNALSLPRLPPGTAPIPSFLFFDASTNQPAFREIYRYRGFVQTPSDSAYGMALAMTLGLAEFCAFPHALGRVLKHSFDVHWFSVWYDNEGRFVYVAPLAPAEIHKFFQ